tara:strand:+ start:283 stop:1092 length:810 start_codon:yes stop_codon:yes gene_type:complete
MDLNGARVLVTGGSKGIGASLARSYAAAGADVVLAARPSAELDAVAVEVGGHAVAVDLTEAAAVEGLIPVVEADLGPVDVLVNNAGMETIDMAAVIDPAVIRATTRLNLEAPMVLTRHVLPLMLERGRGHLVFLSSIAGTAGFPTMATYCATKAGISNFVRALTLELKATSIGTTTVAPGPVATRMWEAVESTSSSGQKVLDRMNAVRMLPIADPDRLAHKVVTATRRGTRHVRTPRRLMGNFLMAEGANRMTCALLAGVKLDPTDSRP